MNLLTIHGMKKAYTDRELFDNIDFNIDEGDKIGLIGINGTGKSTLLKIIAGLEECDEGEVTKGNKVYINYLDQNPIFKKGISIYDYVVTANRTEDNQWELEGEAKAILNKLGFLDYSNIIDTLSGGQKKKVALAGALLSTCEILILDEPTNHLDNDMTEWLETYLKEYKGALVMVTHDRYFLDLVCNIIVEIDKGQIYRYQSNYEGYLILKNQREDMAYATQRKHDTIMRKEIQWMQRGAKARSTKQKAHIARYEALKNEEKIVEDGKVEINALASRLGKKTVEVNKVSKSYDNKKLIDNFTYIFLKEDRIGIIGPNGCGKTTLLKIINHIIEPDTGCVEVGETVNIGYFSQDNQELNENQKVIESIRDVAEYIKTSEGTVSASQMLEQFLFDSTLQYTLIGKLSGGERRRLQLLKVLMAAPNVLILDEPTNDLDIKTLQILEDYLDYFNGIVITVSHDRYFLDRIVSRLFVFDEGIIKQHEGNYTDYYLSEKEKDITEKSKVLGTVESKQDAGKNKKVKTEKLKFSFNEQKEYDSIESEIEKIEQEIASIEEEILRVSTDFVKLNKLSNEKVEKEQLYQDKLERFFYLEERASQILQ